MYNPGVQEYWDDEAPPLVRLMAAIPVIFYTRLIRDAAHAAEFGKGAAEAASVEGGSVGARPGLYVGGDCLVDVVHAGGESCAHVDEDVGGGADHYVEVGLCLDWGAGKDAF